MLIENIFSFPQIQVNGRYIIARDSFILVEKFEYKFIIRQKKKINCFNLFCDKLIYSINVFDENISLIDFVLLQKYVDSI